MSASAKASQALASVPASHVKGAGATHDSACTVPSAAGALAPTTETVAPKAGGTSTNTGSLHASVSPTTARTNT